MIMCLLACMEFEVTMRYKQSTEGFIGNQISAWSCSKCMILCLRISTHTFTITSPNVTQRVWFMSLLSGSLQQNAPVGV